MDTGRIAKTFELTGVVQGVGLRPALFGHARRAGLGGRVQNRSGVVRLRLEGDPRDVSDFARRLPQLLPPNARLETFSEVESEPLGAGEAAFRILPSEAVGRPAVVIPADLALCDGCRREVLDSRDRRYGYPFTSCTCCGPRYTVVESMPYDRERTTLSAFPLCPACRAEYEDPRDRRFHAESVACPRCGPRLSLLDAAGRALGGDPLRQVRAALACGKIVAVRGVGGFLLAADARNGDALRALRDRKRRPHKPFAVLAPDVAAVRRFCEVSPEAEALLASPEAPIVILNLLPGARSPDAPPYDLLTPDAATLGVMLPTSPLHLLLLQPLADDPVRPFDLLVMTSGNRGGEPLCLSNAEAVERLAGIADLFLCHDREINMRADDSLAVLQRGGPQLWRRARGYAPNALLLARPLCRCVLALGADLKNAVAVGFGERVVVSPHVGDLATPEALDGLERVTHELPRFLEWRPEAVAVDLHPDMWATRAGRRLAAEWGVPVIEVQHHHAHAAAVFAEHGVESGLALVMDGTGLGPDGTIWGAELLSVRPGGYERLATFAPVPLPGGDEAVWRPARQAVARWADAGVEPDTAALLRLGVTPEEASVWRQQCERGLNAPYTHSAGRLFDAFAAVLGLAPERVTYEGQTAIRLESAAWRAAGDSGLHVPYALAERDGVLAVSWREAFARLAGAQGAAAQGLACEWALAAHRAIAQAALDMIDYGISRQGVSVVALSGGVTMNRLLNDLLVPRLEAAGIRVLIHRLVPPNDGCIALGQAVVAGGEGNGCAWQFP